MKKFFLILLGIAIIISSLFFFSHRERELFAQSVIFQDDFEKDLSNWTIYHVSSPNSITLSSNKSQNGSRSLLLHYEGSSYVRIDHVFDTPQTGIASIYFWDDMDPSMGTFTGIKDADETQMVFLGVNTNVNPSEYVYRTGNPPDIGSYIQTHIPRSQGWHKFELVSTPKGSYGKIDGINLAFLANNDQGRGAVNTEFTSFSKIISASTWGLASDAYYDNLKVVKFDSLPSSITERERALLEVFASQPPTYDPKTQIYRQKGNRATVLALLGQNENEAKNLIREVAQDYNLWDKDWGSPIPACDLGVASWLMWDKLDSGTRNLVQNVIIKEANYWLTQNPQSGYINDSKSEENAWTASFLALATNMFPNHANASNWDAKAKLFAFHTFTINENYGGITTQTLHSDYLLDNHNYHPNPHYAISAGIGELARGASFYNKTGKNIPDEFKHNVVNVWNAHKPYVSFSNYLWQNCQLAYNFNGKDDWYADATTGDNAFIYVSLLSGNDVISDLSAYEYYILRDYQGSYPLQPAGLKYLLDSVDAKRNAIALLYYDNSFSFPSTTTSFSLSPGWNQITWPDVSGKKASDIPTECPVAVAKENFWFTPFVKNFGGVNFNFESRKTYYLKCNQEVTWNL